MLGSIRHRKMQTSANTEGYYRIFSFPNSTGDLGMLRPFTSDLERHGDDIAASSSTVNKRDGYLLRVVSGLPYM